MNDVTYDTICHSYVHFNVSTCKPNEKKRKCSNNPTTVIYNINLVISIFVIDFVVVQYE